MTLTLPSPDLPVPDVPQPPGLTRPQKAAVLVQVLLGEGATLGLQVLPEDLQMDLAETLASLGDVDQATKDEVIEEFARELSGQRTMTGTGLNGALRLLDGTISPALAQRLRAKAGASNIPDPWEKIAEKSVEKLQPILEREAIEVCAVILSKLNVSKAAELLGALPGERARRITYSISQVNAVRPDAVNRIGQALAVELAIEPERAFASGPVERVGAILNSTRAMIRNEVLTGLDETDSAFAEEVRQAIFTFANIPERIDPRDIPKIIRGVEQDVLVTALAAATGELEDAAEFILSALSKRMADGLREEVAEKGAPAEDEGEAAMGAVVASIRELEESGEIYLVSKDKDQGAAAPE